MKNQQEEQQMMNNVEIYDKIALYLIEEEMITPAERIKFMEFVQEGMLS